MKFLVTGCAGFIGSNLVEKLLLNSDNFVIGIDNFDAFYPKEIKQNNLKNFINNKKFEFYETDITNKKELKNIFSKHNIECVIHLAAKAGVRPSFDKQEEYIATNINGTQNILELMNKYNIQKLIFTSSSSVYGNADYEKLSEDIENLSPISPYANTKLECEKIIREYTQKTDINAMARTKTDACDSASKRELIFAANLLLIAAECFALWGTLFFALIFLRIIVFISEYTLFNVQYITSTDGEL